MMKIKKMANDKGVGAFLLLGSIVLLLCYFWLVLSSYWWLAMEIVGTTAVVGILGILGWIGWTLATTPPPTPIEEVTPSPIEGAPQQGSTSEDAKEQGQDKK